MAERRFENLEVWKTARALTGCVYSLTAREPFRRDFGLSDQMRRSSVSVLSNIAEGHESRTDRLFLEFLGRAKGSCGELRAQAYISLDAQYVKAEEFDALYELCDKCSRQISRLMVYISRGQPKQ